jgi:nucleoside-diphosphate-sugar epimerase
MKSSRFVVLGASGFLGTALCEYFGRFGEHCVVGYSLPEVDFRDLRQTVDLSKEILPTDIVICCAAVKRQFGDSVQTLEDNLKISFNVASFLKAARPRKVLYLSSAAVYGEDVTNLRINESTALTPTSYYGLSKMVAEQVMQREYAALPNAQLIVARPPLIFGLGDTAATYGPAGFLKSAQQGVPIELWGDGAEMRDFLFVDDFCRIAGALLNSDFHGAVNLATGVSRSFSQIVEVLRSLYPSLQCTSRSRTKKRSDHQFDNSLLRDNLPVDFSFTALEAAINEMLRQSTSGKSGSI